MSTVTTCIVYVCYDSVV